jgi:putative ABC transport system ATP-binding protein
MIELESVHKTFRSGRGFVNALKDVSFVVEKGSATAVVGKSGSGKSTLLNCIGGLERPDKGSIACFGHDILALSGRALSAFQRQSVGFIFQHGNLLSYLSVSENIAFPLTLNGIAGNSKTQRVQVLLEKIGLSAAAKAMPHELSGGEIQRVSAARALAHSPRMLLADEPTASLDTDTGKNLIDLMFEMGRAQGCTMIISTHDPEICGLADKTIYLRDGERLKEAR